MAAKTVIIKAKRNDQSLRLSNLPKETKEKFLDLKEKIKELRAIKDESIKDEPDPSDPRYEQFFTILREQVEGCPDLAGAICPGEGPLLLMLWKYIETPAAREFGVQSFYIPRQHRMDMAKFLIETNQDILLLAFPGSPILSHLAPDPDMLTWLVTNPRSQWIFRDPRYQRCAIPAHFQLFSEENYPHPVTTEHLKIFFREFPQALGQSTRSNETLLHWVASSKNHYPHLEWLAERYPAALMRKNDDGRTPLHLCCLKLVERLEYPAIYPQREVLQSHIRGIHFLIRAAPGAVAVRDKKHIAGMKFTNSVALPKQLLRFVGRPSVQGVILSLLRRLKQLDPDWLFCEFVTEAWEVIREERVIIEQRIRMERTKRIIFNASESSSSNAPINSDENEDLLGEAYECYKSWAKNRMLECARVDGVRAKMNAIKKKCATVEE